MTLKSVGFSESVLFLSFGNVACFEEAASHAYSVLTTLIVAPRSGGRPKEYEPSLRAPTALGTGGVIAVADLKSWSSNPLKGSRR
jgi:hypothetical protein